MANPVCVLKENPIGVSNPVCVLKENLTDVANPVCVLKENPTDVSNPVCVLKENPTKTKSGMKRECKYFHLHFSLACSINISTKKGLRLLFASNPAELTRAHPTWVGPYIVRKKSKKRKWLARDVIPYCVARQTEHHLTA